MRFIKTDFEGLYIIEPNKIEDDRGFFIRNFCKNEFSEIGFNKEFVQSNLSFNKTIGTIRGMHFQNKPYEECKLVRCVQGRIFDVAVDLRPSSSTFLKYIGIELSMENMLSIFIPEGFAHGFQTLENNTSLLYFHSEYYTPQADTGIRFNDPVIDIKWPLNPVNISEKDQNYPLINIK